MTGGEDNAEIRTRLYRAGVLELENFPIADISDYIAQPDCMVWADLCGPHQSELTAVAVELDLHQLAVEDAQRALQRPKLDRYSTHAFLNVYSVALDGPTGALHTGELSAFLLPNALVTIRKDDRFDIAQVVDRWDNQSDLLKFGVAGLVYGLLDFVVDGHFDAVQQFDEELELIEDGLFDRRNSSIDVQRRSFELRKSLANFRRVVLPMREVLNSLMRRDVGIAVEGLLPFYQDIYDHVLRVTEWTDSLRDLVTSILETNLAIESNALNVITKKVTSWAAIIAVPTLVTGFYGMNVPYPGFASRMGLIVSVIIMVFASTGLYFLFRRKQWL